MKKFLSFLSIIAIFGLMTPAFAAPGEHGRHGGHGGPPHRGGHHIQAGHNHHYVHHRPHHTYRPYYHSHVNFGGVLARRSYWSNPYYCDYRLGWCDDYYYSRPYYRSNGVYVNLGIPIRF